jgi:hypothetical protein
MYRLFVGCAVLTILAGCASSVTGSARQARNDSAAQAAQAAPGVSSVPASPALPAGAPVTMVDIEDFDYRTVCKDVTKPGTRIVVGQRCYSVSEKNVSLVQDAAVEAAMREQAEVTREARERDLERQLPVLMMRR